MGVYSLDEFALFTSDYLVGRKPARYNRRPTVQEERLKGWKIPSFSDHTTVPSTLYHPPGDVKCKRRLTTFRDSQHATMTLTTTMIMLMMTHQLGKTYFAQFVFVLEKKFF